MFKYATDPPLNLVNCDQMQIDEEKFSMPLVSIMHNYKEINDKYYYYYLFNQLSITGQLH